ncbi:MAG: imidazole glycerol phosphate synthase subunit HisH, partial [Pseudomonadota bacterium]
MTTVIVDYRRGNVQSVCRAIEKCGGTFELSPRPEDLARADRVILPGVGAFGDCIGKLRSMGFVEPLQEFAKTGKPFLGICVGMQIFHTGGEEFGAHDGLNYIPGKVTAIPKVDANGKPHKIPHIGWTPLAVPQGQDASYWDGTILEGQEVGAPVYFVHSYTASPDDPSHRLADAHYNGVLIGAAVKRDNLTGVQFH